MVIDDGQRPVEGHHAIVADVSGVVGEGRGRGSPERWKGKAKFKLFAALKRKKSPIIEVGCKIIVTFFKSLPFEF